MVPRDLPDVLPTDRLNQRGVPVRSIRDDFRHIPNARNALTVVMCLAQSFGVVIAAASVNTWWSYGAAFVLMTRGHACLNILAHEAAHRLLFTKRWANDTVGRFLLAYPTYQAFLAYRRVHFAHHRDEMGPDEPDTTLYAGYPVSSDSWRRKLVRDATGQSGWKNFRSLGHAIRSGRREALTILAVHVALLGASIAFMRPLAYVVWVASWMTVWKVSNRLRAVAEHARSIVQVDRERLRDPLLEVPISVGKEDVEIAVAVDVRHLHVVGPATDLGPRATLDAERVGDLLEIRCSARGSGGARQREHGESSERAQRKSAGGHETSSSGRRRYRKRA